MNRKRLFTALYGLVCLGLAWPAFSQEREFTQKIWPDAPPGGPASTAAESVTNRGHEQNERGLNRSISHVSEPTFTVLLPPAGQATGAAVLVFPGGAFNRVVIDKEGLDVGRFLAGQGVAAVVVKYRTGAMGDARPVADARQVLRTVRQHAAAWGLDPQRVGAVGFSAGGYLAASLCTIKDGAPDFLAAIYAVYPDSVDAARLPPTFLVWADDDGDDIKGQNRSLFRRLQEAGVPTEAHLYARGGHGFGLGVRGGAVASWPERFVEWLAGLEGSRAE